MVSQYKGSKRGSKGGKIGAKFFDQIVPENQQKKTYIVLMQLLEWETFDLVNT